MESSYGDQRANIEILQRFQSKTLRVITNAPWFVPNNVIHGDLNVTTFRSEISTFCEKYQHRLLCHPNEPAVKLVNPTRQYTRLKRSNPLDLVRRCSQ